MLGEMDGREIGEVRRIHFSSAQILAALIPKYVCMESEAKMNTGHHPLVSNGENHILPLKSTS